ncbi:hypothetical protein Q3G72_002367 [Acer saccharum]|nr:hypothetical protein Q3G72_002367 [Acer saccharum]
MKVKSLRAWCLLHFALCFCVILHREIDNFKTLQWCLQNASSRKKKYRSQRRSGQRLTLDCDLDFDIEDNGLKGSAIHQEGFAYCWSDTPPDQQLFASLGISEGDEPIGNLGETEHSFGFGGTEKSSNAAKFSDFSEKFIRPLASIGFSKNGKLLGTAKHFDAGLKGLGVVDSMVKEIQWQSAVFPRAIEKCRGSHAVQY